MRKLLLVLLLTGLFTSVYGVNTRIDGTISGFYKKTLYLWVVADQITGRKALLGTAYINDTGVFSLQVEVEDTLPAFLSIGHWKALFYILPGSHYRCSIPINYDSLLQVRIPPARQFLPLQFENLPDNDPNFLIPRFDEIYQRFLANHSEALIKYRNTSLYDSLLRQVEAIIPLNKKDFTGTYAVYNLAMLEGLLNRWSTSDHFNRFLKDKPVLYNNPGYMTYFNDLFDHYLTRKSRNITFQDLDATINKNASLAALTDSLGKDATLWNERLRELVLLKNLGQLYPEESFNKTTILQFIKQIENSSKFLEHRLIASNLAYSLVRLTKGCPAPVFSMIDQLGREKTLQDYQGKWVYLEFFTTWCEECISEMKVVSSLRRKFDQQVSFLSIACDEDPLSLMRFLQANKEFDWSFFPIEGSAELLEEYQVLSYPLFVLIDPEGKIYRYPAVRPSEGAEIWLKTIIP